ncbi:MAG TPA: dTDP-4-dehydrorhamnose 3,5-epimerase [Patescibacteria group bacterium]
MIHTFKPTPDNQVDQYAYQTPIEGLLYIEHKRFDDNRGFYAELDRVPEIEKALDIDFKVKQINLSHSKPNVIRGIHAENWNKLLMITRGTIFAAWVDFRKESATFGEVVTMTVGDHNETALFGSVFVSAGIGNSFCVTDGPVDYLYAVDQLYAERDPSGDVAISVFDPELAIPWPITKEHLVISDRDLQAVSFKEKFSL